MNRDAAVNPSLVRADGALVFLGLGLLVFLLPADGRAAVRSSRTKSPAKVSAGRVSDRPSRLAPVKPKAFDIYLEGLYEYDSNVLQLPETDDSAQTGRSDVSFNATFFGEYRPSALAGSHLRVLGLYQDYKKLNELDLGGAVAGLQQDFEAFERQVRLRYDVQHFFLDRKSYLWTHSPALEADLWSDKPWKFTAGYRLDIKRFVSAQYRGFDGLRHEAAFTLEREGKEVLSRCKAQASGFREDVHDAASRHDGLRGAGELGFMFPWDVELVLQPEVQTRWYEQRGSEAQPYRREIMQKYATSLSRFFWDHVTIEASYSRIFNGSTISRYVYRKWIGGAAVSVVF